MKKALTLSLLVLLSLMAGIAFAETIKVYVSIVPQQYFVEKIGGDLVNVSVMVTPGASPVTYEPKPRQMVGLTETKVYFAIGVPFERVWLHKVASANPKMTVVYTEAGIEKIPMKAYHHWDEKLEHGHQDEPHHNREEAYEHHHHGLEDPHVWLSPPLVILQARNILQTMIRVDPTHRPIYEKNYQDFVFELVELDRKLRGIFAGKGEDVEFMVFHPSWGYFAEAYGLVQIPVEIEGKEPKPAELEELIRYAKGKGIKAVFVQPQLSSQSAQTIAKEIGGQVVFVDPLASDWANNLLDVAAKFEAALR